MFKKNANKMGIKGTFYNIIEVIYQKKNQLYIILNRETVDVFSLSSCTLPPLHTATMAIQQSVGIPCQSYQVRNNNNNNKGIPIGNEDIKFSLFAYDKSLYRRDKWPQERDYWNPQVNLAGQQDTKSIDVGVEAESASRNVHAAESNIHIQYYPSENSSIILLSTGKDNIKLYLEFQATMNSQNHSEE